MPESVYYRSRFPEIIAALKPRIAVALRAGAEAVEQEAKIRVPVASGDLRDAIHTEVSGSSVYVIAGDHDAFYGHLVEHGTTRVPARPFLVPALESQRETIVTEVNAVLREL